MIDRRRIAKLIPHAGAMCLLDEVIGWNATSIRCRTARHRRPDNPLRRADGSMGAVCGAELAAQAMALHGRLIGDDTRPPQRGYLASLRDLRLRTARLDQAEELAVDAVLLASDGRSATYSFAVNGTQGELLAGRATVIFEAAER